MPDRAMEPIEIRSVDGVITLTDLDALSILAGAKSGNGVMTLPEVMLGRDGWERTGTVALVPVQHIVKVTMSAAQALASSRSEADRAYSAKIGIGGEQDAATP